MTTLQINGAGSTNGATISAATTSGTGDTPFSFAITTGGTFAWDSANLIHGFNSMKTVGNNTSGAVYGSWTGLSLTQVSARVYCKITANPIVEAGFFYFSDSAGGKCTLALTTAGRIRFYNNGVTTTGTVAIPLNTWVRVDVAYTLAASGAVINVQMANLDSTTAIDSISLINQNTTLGASGVTVTSLRSGLLVGTTTSTFSGNTAQPVVTDTLAPGAFIAPYGVITNAAPTVSAGPTQTVTTGQTVTLAGTSSDSDGFISAVAWSQLSGPTQALSSLTINGPTFTATGTGICVFQYTATDNSGAQSSSPVTININSTSSRPSATVSNAGAFTNVGGAASIEAALADELDTSYAQSPTGPAGAVIIFGITPLATGSITVKHRSKQDIASPVITRVSELLQAPSNTVIASHSDNLTTSWVDYTWAVTDIQAANITDRNALRVRITDTQN